MYNFTCTHGHTLARRNMKEKIHISKQVHTLNKYKFIRSTEMKLAECRIYLCKPRGSIFPKFNVYEIITASLIQTLLRFNVINHMQNAVRRNNVHRVSVQIQFHIMFIIAIIISIYISRLYDYCCLLLLMMS